MTREDTARHEKTRQGTRRHGKAREGTGTRARGTRAQNISYSQRMAEVSPVAKRFGKFTFFCNFADSEGQKFSQNMCILFCRPTQTRKHFQDLPGWYLLLDLAALNENITFQLRSFSLEDDS